MEQAQKDSLSAKGSRTDAVKQMGVFREVVEKFRGRKLGPTHSRCAPYPEEWQLLSRLTVVPKTLSDFLLSRESRIYENELPRWSIQGNTVLSVIREWAGSDRDRTIYGDCLIDFFNKFLFRNLLYASEIRALMQQQPDIVKQCGKNFADIFPTEFVLRLTTFVPLLVTAACECVLTLGADTQEMFSLLKFINCHQNFLAYLEKNIAELLSTPMISSTADESPIYISDTPLQANSASALSPRRRIRRISESRELGKRKGRKPVEKKAAVHLELIN
jgi:hypothetical protein